MQLRVETESHPRHKNKVITVNPEGARHWRVWVEISSPGFQEGTVHRFYLVGPELGDFLREK